MAAFEKIKSGFPEMDEILDHIRLGDTVGWEGFEIKKIRVFGGAFGRAGGRGGGKNSFYIFVPQ